MSNQSDSCQILQIDSSGTVLNDSLILNRKILDFRIWKDQIIMVVFDTSLQIIYHDLSFQEINRYSFSNEFPITYNQLLFKDSLVTAVVYNNVNGVTYGTRNITEIRVLDMKGNYLRRCYLRYNGGYMGIIPKNAIGIAILGIDYTSDNGYYMTLNMDAGTLDSRYGILKTDSNVMANDTIFVPAVRLYLNQWDTILTPMPADTTGVTQIIHSLNNITIYPNPASNQIFISGLESTNTNFKLYNLEGKLVLTGTLGIENNINVSNLIAGTYILNLETAKGMVRKKILVE